jgi:plastocyanin
MMIRTALVLAAVLLVACNTKDDEPLPANHVRITDVSFDPDSLTVASGALVTWVNLGHSIHTIASGRNRIPDSLWNSGPLASGDSFARTFDMVGTWPYFCSFHAGMAGVIRVTGSLPPRTDTVGDFILTHQVEPDSNLLHITLSAPGTGYVAVGFNSSPLMEGANIILGCVRNDSAFTEDDFGNAPNSHASDISLGGQDNVLARSGTEAGGRTELNFTIPLNSGDSRDLALAVGQTYSVILARGATDDFSSYHVQRAGTLLTL